jgi:glycosyltransferase involved in cell wall biosynthesis
MNIVMLVESLGSGGAERQVCTLAGEFKRRGHQVCVATYSSGDFYLPLLERESVEHCFLGGHGKVSWAMRVRRFMRTHAQDVVLAFLEGPSAYAELAGLPSRSWGLVVSERLARPRNRFDPKLWLHGLADYIVANSHANRLIVERRCPWLTPKLVTVYNAVRIEGYQRAEGTSNKPGEVRLIVAARFARQKNVIGLINALANCESRTPPVHVAVDWYGNAAAEPGVFAEAQRELARLGLEGRFHLRPPTDRIHEMMSRADAVLLPSFYEGLPNAVCEGMALGKPILMSAVCDAGNLVQEGINGFLFDPHSPGSIADAIERFAMLAPEDRARLGRASRARAELLFDVNTVVEHYLRILEAAAARKALKIEHWPEEVPDTASRSHPESNGGGLVRG